MAGKIPSPYYRVSIKALIFDRQQRLLVIQTLHGRWQLPGGGWEHEETMQACLRREIMEELGVGVRDIDFTTMYPYAGITRHDNRGLKLAIPVILEPQELELGDDMKAYQYVTPVELASLIMNDDEAGIKTHIPRIWPTS